MNKTLLLKVSIIGCLLFSTLIASAQQGFKKHTVGISAGFGSAEFVHLKKVLGGASYDVQSLANYGIFYVSKLKGGVGFETGLYYLNRKLNVEASFTGTPVQTVAHSFDLLSIPVGLRVNFLKYFYWNTAALIDIEVNNSGGIRNQSALGINLGLGANYFFKNNIGIYINPQVAHRTLYYFKGKGNEPLNLEYNTTFGLAYKL